MTQEEFNAALLTLGVPVAYYKQKAGTKVPFINYTWHKNAALCADDKVYTKKTEVKIEVVCNTKRDLNRLSDLLEALLENIAPWTSEEGESDEEQIYINTYTLEV